jgi:hypothetical protein
MFATGYGEVGEQQQQQRGGVGVGVGVVVAVQLVDRPACSSRKSVGEKFPKAPAGAAVLARAARPLTTAGAGHHLTLLCRL